MGCFNSKYVHDLHVLEITFSGESSSIPFGREELDASFLKRHPTTRMSIQTLPAHVRGGTEGSCDVENTKLLIL